MSKEIYAAVYVRSDTMSLKFAEADLGSASDKVRDINGLDFELTPYANGIYDKKIKFRHEDFKKYVHELLKKVREAPGDIDCLIISSYGPILSVNVDDRKAIRDPERHDNYGRISERSVHVELAGVNLYKIFRDEIDTWDKNIEILVQTDVVCGAIHESYIRRNPPSGQRQLKPNDLLVFINIAEGIGGAIVADLVPIHRTIHPEFGFLTGQILADDDYGKSIIPQAGDTQVSAFYEILASSKALLARSKVNELKYVSKEDWATAARYIAQLCASVTFLIGPNQFVLHGDFQDEARYSDGTKIGFINMVFRDLRTWLGSSNGRYINYEELGKTSFIDSSIRLSWPNHKNGEKGRISPSHHGAFILAARR